MNIKQCTKCKNELPANENNFYRQGDKLHSWCKKCFLEYRKEHQQRKEVKERNSEYIKEYYIHNKEKFSYQNKDINKFKKYQKEYRQREDVKQNLKFYNQKRREHKSHEISKDEWLACKEYFNYSCAYCGLTEEDHKKMHNQQLHKEHVDHEGANDLSNCVPSCKSCNSSKHMRTLEDWYNENNNDYTKERMNKIEQWLQYDFYTYIEYKNYLIKK